MFKAGTGWLGWTPDVVLRTPICQLVLAIEGKGDFARMTNPFGAKPDIKPADEATIKKRRATLDTINAKAATVLSKKK